MGTTIEVQRSTLVLLCLLGALSLICTGLGVALNKYVVQYEGDATESTETTITLPVASTTMAPTEPWEKEYRLPKEVLPLSYDILLHPDLVTGLFTGSVKIQLDVKDSRNYILVHQKFLTITKTDVWSAVDTKPIGVEKAFEYQPNEFWVIILEDNLQPGEYWVNLEFNGSLTNDIVGFYKSEYTTDKGEKRAIATSKFEPTYARRAFPCLDEPGFKPTYNISLVRPSGDGYIALSNMPEAGTKPDTPAPGLTTVVFEPSVKMVTYLACFIVCDFDYITGRMENGKEMRVYATPHQKDNIGYALDVGLKVTNFYDKYFGIEYVLPKQDLIAIPDFVSGAMEHWGLITFRETALLYNSRTNSPANKQRVATVVAHELAHQWFGNLMTIKWWDDLWLNEGFASYMEYKGVTAAEPDWDMDTLFITDDLTVVLQLDAKLSSHPIVVPVNHPDEITEIFDTISYNKGAAVLRMLEFFMGSDSFQKGVSQFLKDYQFDNAETLDLWNTLNGFANGLNIPLIMDTWTKQMGLPVLTLRREGSKYRVTQARYLADPESVKNGKVKESPFNYRWEIPVSYFTDLNAEATISWFHMEDSDILVEVPAGAKWIKFNSRFTGYYRINYPEEDWKTLSDLLNTNMNALLAADRASLIDDAFALAESGHSTFSIALDIVKYLGNERHPTPWTAASGSLGRMYMLLRKGPIFMPFKKYLADLTKDPADQTGWNEDDDHLTNLLRSTILDFACEVGVESISTGAADRFKSWIADETYYLSPNIRSVVYVHGMKAVGDEATWKVVWERYLKETDVQEKTKLLYGLSSVREPWILNQYLILAKNESYIRSQDFFSVVQYIAGNPVGEPIVWNFVRDEWMYLVNRFTLNNRYLGNMVKSITSRFSTQLQLDEMNKFFSDYPDAGAGARGREQALETVRNNIKWVKTNTPVVEEWLKENGWMN